MKSKLFIFGSLAALIATDSQAATAIKSGTGTDLSSTLVGVWSGGGGTNGAPNTADVATWNATSITGALTVDNPVSWGQISFLSSLAATTTLSGQSITLNVVDTATEGTWALTNYSGKVVTISNAISFLGSGRHTIQSSNTNSNLTINGNVTSPNTLMIRGNSTSGNTLAGEITVPTILTKADGGTWSLTNNVNSIGSVTFGGGRINVGNDSALGAATVTLAGSPAITVTLGATSGLGDRTLANNFTTSLVTNHTLTVDTANANIRLNGNITDSSGGLSLKLTKSGANTLTLAGSNTFTGVLAVNVGGLSFLNTTAQPAGGSTTVAANATLGLGVSSSSPFSAAQVNALLAGTLVPAVTMDPAAIVGIDTTGGDFSYNPDAVYARGLAKLGTHTLTLSGTNAHTGSTSVNGGTLALGGATNTLNDTAAVIVDGATAILSLDGNSDTVGAVTLKRGGQITGSGTLTGSSYAFENGSVSAILGGSGVVLTKTTADTVTLSNANTYTGGTTVSGGTLTVDNADALGGVGGGTVLVNGAQALSVPSLRVNPGLTVANALTLKRGLSGTGRANIVIGAGSDWSGDITLDNTNAGGFAALLTNNVPTTTASVVSGNIGVSVLGTPSSSSPTLVLRGGQLGKVTGNMSLQSTGYLVITDGSNWEISGATNTWGTLDIASEFATVTVGANNTLKSDAVVVSNPATVSGGTLQLNNQANTDAFDQTIAGLSGKVKVGLTTGAATLTLNTAADQSTSGAISGAISLVKMGAAVQTLSGTNSYTGNTTVSAGTLVIADNAQLRFLIGDTSGASNTLTGTGAVTLDGDFNIDTTLTDASALTSGAWTLENVASPTYNGTFQVISGVTPWDNSGDEWTKSVGAKTYTFNKVSGILTLTSSGGYDAWATTNGLIGLDANFDADPDNDGLDNGIEFVLGGQPNPANVNSNSNGLLPKVAQTGGNMTFTFNREDLSEPGVNLTFQWSTDLTFPSPANDVPIGPDDSVTDTIVVDVTEDDPDADTDKIVITVPAAKAAGGKVFGRLKTVKLP